MCRHVTALRQPAGCLRADDDLRDTQYVGEAAAG